MSETEELIRALDDPPLYPCVAQFHNECPSDWGVHIFLIAAVFYYDDGTNEQAGPVQVDIAGPNGMVPLNSPKPTKCVTRVFGAVSVKAPGHDAQNFTKLNTGEPDHCMLLTHFVIGPKKSVSKADFKTLSPQNALSFETR